MKAQGIFFDFDGVIVLSEALHLHIWNNLLKEHEIEHPPLELEEFIGLSDWDVGKRLHKKDPKTPPVESLVLQKRRDFLKSLSPQIPAPEGRNAFIEHVSKKARLGIVSSSSRLELTTILKHEGLLDFFEFLICGDETPKHKPDPLPYLLALEASGLSKEEVFAIEDSPAGMTSAKEAGIAVYLLGKKGSPDFNHLLATLQKEGRI